MKFQIGQKVQLNPKYAKWHLHHQEIYKNPRGIVTKQAEAEQEIENYMHFMCCFGVPIIGKITCQGADSQTWGVLWTVPTTREKVFYYVLNRDLLTTKD